MRKSRAVWVALIGAMCLTATPESAEGQLLTLGPCRTPAKPEFECFAADAQELAAGLRAGLVGPEQESMQWVLFTLTQYFRPYPAEELDAIADALVEVAVEIASRRDPDGTGIRANAVSMLANAAIWRPNRAANGGVAYAGALDRVVELAFRLPGGDIGVLGRARPAMGDEQYFAHLREIVTSTLPASRHAVLALRWEGPEGLEVLREIYESDLAGPNARDDLIEVALGRGWRDPGPSR